MSVCDGVGVAGDGDGFLCGCDGCDCVDDVVGRGRRFGSGRGELGCKYFCGGLLGGGAGGGITGGVG